MVLPCTIYISCAHDINAKGAYSHAVFPGWMSQFVVFKCLLCPEAILTEVQISALQASVPEIVVKINSLIPGCDSHASASP